MERHADPREPVGTGGRGRAAARSPASWEDIHRNQPPGPAVLGGVSLLGMALLFSDGLCPFLGVVLSSSFLSCPSHPRAGCNHRVAVSGGGLVSSPVYREAGLPALPCPTSRLPKRCCTRGVRLVISRAGGLRSCCSQWATSPFGGGSRSSASIPPWPLWSDSSLEETFTLLAARMGVDWVRTHVCHSGMRLSFRLPWLRFCPHCQV